LRSAEVRLFQHLPLLTLAALLVSLRTLHLRLQGQWAVWQSLALALITTQFAAALHYWPLPPITFGMVLIGPVYALTSLTGNLAEGEPPRQAILEPSLVLLIVWGAAVWTF
jgi:hypothetical protein